MYQRYSRPRQRFQGAYINPNRFVNKAVDTAEKPAFVALHSFNDFKISEPLKRAIALRGYKTPTPIQDKAIAPILEGKDVIGLANTGTGKTAAFIVPLIERLQKRTGGIQALIVAPTRELAAQINDEFRAFSQGMNLYSVLCVGGTSLYQQRSALARGAQVVIGTPGRLKDLANKNALRLGSTQFFVLDEVDRMLDMGFIADIRHLVSLLPKARQSLCFSATLTPAINQLIQTILINPITVSVGTPLAAETIEQDIIRADSQEKKLEILGALLDKKEFEKVLIFGQTKHGVQRLSENLSRRGHKAQAIHGNKSQPQRQRALAAFKNNQIKVLVATDVAARGLDIPNVSHVINFDQPQTFEDYIHRIGRTGRAGKKGQALTFVRA